MPIGDFAVSDQSQGSQIFETNRLVVILSSLDTKGHEANFLRERIRAEGGRPLLVDTGTLGQPATPADVTRQQVAEAAGSSLETILASGDKSYVLEVMADGAAHIVRELLAKGHLGGVLSIGGGRGTALGTRVMQALPVGLPKLMVSTLASGSTPFGPYVGTRDVTMMPAVADILGVNAVTRPVLSNAAAAIVAMSRAWQPVQRGQRPILAASMLGASTPLVERIHSLMDAAGCEVVAFHAVGTGGRAMEELIDAGLFDAVFDVTPAELTAWVAGGPHSAGPQRMWAASRRGLPQVIAPGGLDFIIEGPPESLPERYAGRQTMRHAPTLTLVRASADELAEVAQRIAERLAASNGPAAAILTRRSFSAFAAAGQPLHNPDMDRAFIEALKACVPPNVRLIELDADLNDPLVADTAVRLMQEMLA